MWDPSTGEYLEQENCMTDHQAQIIVPATMATKWVFIIAVISYSLAHDTIIVIDADTYSTALVFRILVSVVVWPRENFLAESAEDDSSHNSKRGKDYAQPLID